jgi:hypothetical protein
MNSIRRVLSRYARGEIGPASAMLEISNYMAEQPVYRHEKTGGLYFVQTTDAMLQWPTNEYDCQSVTLYYPAEGTKDPMYARLTQQFMDGRFAKL